MLATALEAKVETQNFRVTRRQRAERLLDFVGSVAPLTDAEVESFAKMANVSEEVLRVIGAVVPQTEFHAFNHAGHYVFREHAHKVNQLITNFVKSL